MFNFEKKRRAREAAAKAECSKSQELADARSALNEHKLEESHNGRRGRQTHTALAHALNKAPACRNTHRFSVGAFLLYGGLHTG